jgi:hypothetical protein
MFPILMVLMASVPAFAPAPVFRDSARPKVTGDVVGVGIDEKTITLKYNGKETIFNVARNAKVTMNGQKGYSLDDVADTLLTRTRVTLTLTNGVAKSLDVTVTLRGGAKIWGAGMGPGQSLRREVETLIRQREEEDRQRKR